MSHRVQPLSRASRSAFRNLMTSVTLGAIDTEFTEEGFEPGSTRYEDSSARRSRTEEYLAGVDLGRRESVEALLRVMERLVSRYLRTEWASPDDLAPLRRELGRDGYELTDDGTITDLRPDRRYGADGPHLASRYLASLREPSVILEHLTRLADAADADPPRAIGSAKELIESTAKVVLVERGMEFNDRDDVPDLVKRAQESLMLHPTQHAPGPDGTPAVKKILGGLSTVALGVAELRNRGYGTGHGQAASRTGLHPRHAHLAVDAAMTWCRLMLDTLADPDAPWRASGSTG